MSGKPMMMPSACGTVREKPNFAVDAISMRLLGPGVKNAGMAAARNASSRVELIATTY